MAGGGRTNPFVGRDEGGTRIETSKAVGGAVVVAVAGGKRVRVGTTEARAEKRKAAGRQPLLAQRVHGEEKG